MMMCFSFQCFALQDIEQEEDDLCLDYYVSGCINLAFGDYLSALDDFNNASFSNVQEDPIEDFFIHFGKIIAYDHLGLHEECQNTIQSLSRLMNEEEDESCESDKTEDLTTEEYLIWELWLGCLRNLSEQAPTPHVRDYLFSLLDEMMEELKLHK
jgi:hypothetical protein